MFALGDNNAYKADLELVIDNLNRAFISEERLEAVIAACELFNHNEESRHVDEIYAGADRALVKLLKLSMSFAVPDAEEIALLCKAINMIYRCPCKYVWTSYLDVAEILIPLYVQILRLCLNAKDNLDSTIVDISESLLKISNCRFSSDSIDSRPNVDGMAMIAQLVQVANSVVDVQAKINSIIAISNLTHETEDSVLMSMAQYKDSAIPRLLIATSTNSLFGDKMRKVALGGLLNITSLPHNQSKVGTNPIVLGGLCNLLDDKDPDFRRGATAIADCLSKHASNGMPMFKFKKGQLMTNLMKMTTDRDETICRPAINCLRKFCEMPDVEKAMKKNKNNLEIYKCLAKSTAKLQVNPIIRGASSRPVAAGALSNTSLEY
mmetsp:Transcript_1990/g.4020  ORF Transcript_1990/g.4020 Transcript_1990/m.4020 type:complete len:379 (-) Transcript_1990:63-1199(-)